MFAVVQHKTLQTFTRWWDYRQIQSRKVKLEKNLLEDDEVVLKISKPVQTDLGHGLIGLTDRRLRMQREHNQYFFSKTIH